MGVMCQIHSVSVCQIHTYMLQRRVRSPLSKNFPGTQCTSFTSAKVQILAPAAQVWKARFFLTSFAGHAYESQLMTLWHLAWLCSDLHTVAMYVCVCVCVRARARMHVCMYTRMYIYHLYIYVFVYIYMWYMCVTVCIYTYIYMYVCMYCIYI